MNNRNQVESYVPTANFYEGKREAAGKIFRDRFVIADAENEFSIIAFRGEDLQIGSLLPVEETRVFSLRHALERGERVLTGIGDGAALFFGDWMWKGLVPVLLLRDPCADLSAAAKILCRDDILPLGEFDEKTTEKRELSDLCRHFSESLAECDRVFGAEPDLFRRHAARVAEFAGCHANFSELSFDLFALSAADLRKWTLLLFCLFLSLRGISAEEPSFSMRELGREMLLSGVDFSPSRDAKKQTDARFSFLRHPVFRDVELETTPNGLRFSVVLARRQKPGEMRAISPAIRFSFLLETA